MIKVILFPLEMEPLESNSGTPRNKSSQSSGSRGELATASTSVPKKFKSAEQQNEARAIEYGDDIVEGFKIKVNGSYISLLIFKHFQIVNNDQSNHECSQSVANVSASQQQYTHNNCSVFWTQELLLLSK